MTLDDVLETAPSVLEQLTRELYRKLDESMRADAKSQQTACLQLGLRSASIMYGMERVLNLTTIDSYEALNRSAIEAKDLLMHFRFDDKGTRDKIDYWFAGAKDNAWKADHTKVDKFLTKLGAVGIELGVSWSKVSVLTHPTRYAADNSSVVVGYRTVGQLNGLNITQKKADYVVGMSRLILAAATDPPGWISLELNDANMPDIRWFCENAEMIGTPIVNAPVEKPLPEHSFQTLKKAK